MISVGRAGCIRSNIMQAHTGLNALDPLGPGPLYTAYTQNIRPRVQGNRSPGFRVCACTYIRNRENVLRDRVFAFVCIPLPYLHRNRRSVEPRKWP